MAEAASVYPILQLGAVEQRDRLASGALRAVELAGACLEEIGRREPEVGAWAYLDGDHVMQQARKLDEHRARGRPIGPLHGLPVGLKDVIDPVGMPTENGTQRDAGRKPAPDAYVEIGSAPVRNPVPNATLVST